MTGLRNDKGQVAASLFNGEKGFPDKNANAIGRQRCIIKDRTATLEFEGLAAGSYGLALLHDENLNNKMDSNRFGFPREGYGISNNPRPTRRGPKFRDAHFLLTAMPAKQTITVNVKYLRLRDVLR